MPWVGHVITAGYAMRARCDAAEHERPAAGTADLVAETRRECLAGLRARGWVVYSSGQVMCWECSEAGLAVPKPKV